MDFTETIIEDPDLKHLQKVNTFTKQLPNFEQIKKTAFQSFEDIKQNLTKCIIYNELRPGLVYWTRSLLGFIEDHGLFFTKSDHIKLVKFYIELIKIPDIDLLIADVSLLTLSVLLSKFGKLTRKDLVIEWRPLFKLYGRIEKGLNDYNTSVFMPVELDTNTFIEFMKYARIYFDITSTKEMLDEWRPLLCPFSSSITEAFKRFDVFLPTILYEHEAENGYKLWLDEFLKLWTSLSVFYEWESSLISILSRVAEVSIGEFNWNPYIPFIFSNILRGFGLPCGSKQSAQLTLNMVYSEETVEMLSYWIISMIGSSNESRDSCMEHIKSLFQALRSFYHPSNSGSWSKTLFLFLKFLPKHLIDRIVKERQNVHKWYFNSKSASHRINETDIFNFVHALKDVAFTAIFSDSYHLSARKAFQYLTFLRGDIMLPPLIEKLNESISSLIEPDRYTKLLSCAVAIARELATYNPNHAVQTQIYVIPLLSAVLPGIDPNDADKSVLTFEFIDTLLSNIIVCDCSPALQVRNDLTEYEKELIFQTNKFEDVIHELLSKIFNFMDNLTFSEVEESSETAALASKSYAIDNDSHSILLQVFQTLMRQSSKEILKIILNKVKLYIDGNSFNIKSGKVISILCSYLVTSEIGELAFISLFESVYDSLKKFKEDHVHYEHFMKTERCDIDVTWNFQLLSQLVKLNGKYLHNHMHQINEVFSWFRNAINSDAFNYIGFTFENLLTNLVSIAPANLSSVNYSLIFTDENEFFAQHLPIRDWGCRGDINNLNVNFYKPSAAELSLAIKFLNAQLDASIQFLTMSILNTPDGIQLTNAMKKERLREITYIYFILLGGCQLLKRSANKRLITEHIDTNVEIGLKDNLDKGLGFELVNMFNNNHEYALLNSTERSILLTKREHLIEFTIQLINKLNEQQTTEISLLNICSALLSLASIQYGPVFSSFENIWPKKYFPNKLYGKNHSNREELIQKIMIKYKLRTLALYTILNEIDIRIIDTLFQQSTDSIYSSVREKAQKYIFVIFSHYSYSSRTIVPKLLKLLKQSEENKLTHDQLKGCLYLIDGDPETKTLLIKEDWQIISQLWPILFKLQKFEKPSIQYLLDRIHLNICDNFESFDNRTRINDKLVEIVLNWNSKSFDYNSEKRLEWFTKRCQNENKSITSLMNALMRLSNNMSINQPDLIYNLVGMLLNSMQAERSLLTNKCVHFYVESLIHSDLQVREVGLVILCKLLKMTKHKKKKIKIEISQLIPNVSHEPQPGYRDDNTWHLYDPDFLQSKFEASEEDNKKWSQTLFLDKSYNGYYCWPSVLETKSNTRLKQFDLTMKPVESKFKNDTKFIEKFIDLSLIEESKGSEQFVEQKFYLFKALFRNHGSTSIIPNLYQHLIAFVTNRNKTTQECSHKLAAEIIAGLVRGSKDWPLNDLKTMWSKLNMIFDLVIDNLTNENINLWEICFNMMFKEQDPRRMVFFLNYIKDLTKKCFHSNQDNKLAATTSFKQSSCLKLVFCALNQFEWRIPALIESIFEILKSNMYHPSLLVRQVNSICLRACTNKDLDFSRSLIKPSNNKLDERTKLSDLIDFIELNLAKSIDLFDEKNKTASAISDKQAEAIAFMQSFFDWIISHLTSSYQPINDKLIRIIPQICKVDKVVAQDASLISKMTISRLFLSSWILDTKSCEKYIAQLKKVIEFPDWRSRSAAILMIQTIGTFNIFLINDTIRNEILDLLIVCLCDDQLEVRLSASNTLSGFIHSNLIGIDSGLINTFKNLCKFKVKKRDNLGNFRVDSKNLIKKHGGILGLCAIVNAYPYDVPTFLPECVTYLCEFINDTNPIQESVRKCLNEFRRTHHDNWQEHKLKFNETQLVTLADILISPSYYA